MPRGKKKNVPPTYDPGEKPDLNPKSWVKKLAKHLETPKNRARTAIAVVIVVIGLAIISVIF